LKINFAFLNQEEISFKNGLNYIVLSSATNAVNAFLASPKNMVQSAIDNGFKSLAITDHGSCGGFYAFHKACMEKDIKPILVMETYITEDMSIKEKETKW
jgi:DNA polymerase III alpha subunit (gram-positive type)